MKNFKRALAGLSAVICTIGITACGGSDNSGGSNAAPAASNDTPAATEAADNGGAAETEAPAETAETEAASTLEISDEQQEAADQAAEQLNDEELENKTIKWLCHWDLNPSEGQTEDVAMTMFKTKYGGEIKWYPTTWENRYTDLSTYVLGGEGVDFFQRDESSLPKGVVSGMFQPIDDYIDINSSIYDNVRAAMEIYNFNGKHYSFIRDVVADRIVIYNTQTIEEYGFDDPWELYEKGEWNWDTFTKMLEEYVDPDNDCYGLDGWWSEQGLYESGGVPAVSVENGQLKVNLNDPNLEKAEDWMYSLYQKGLVVDKALFEWSEHPEYMGEGKELFFIGGLWHLQGLPENWSTKIDPENARWVPVPCSPDSDTMYVPATADSFCLCKGAANPEGVARFVECCLVANSDEASIETFKEKARSEYHWNEDLIDRYFIINDLARQHPVMELASGVSNDLSDILTYADTQGMKAACHGVPWSQTREEVGGTAEMLVQELNDQLNALS